MSYDSTEDFRGFVSEINSASLGQGVHSNNDRSRFVNLIPRRYLNLIENDTLRVDLHFGNELVALITFECDGGKLFMDGEFSHLWRLSSDCQ